MNVNLWGPELWSVLHGVAALADETAADVGGVLDELRHLLPCPHCLNSYKEYHADLTQQRSMAEQVAAGGGAELVHRIHGMVDDKLESQRLHRLVGELDTEFAGGGEWPAVRRELLARGPRLLTGRPALQVVLKRWALSEGAPFPPEAAWRVLFAFSMVLGHRHACSQQRRASFARFVGHLRGALAPHAEYAALAGALGALHAALAHLREPYGTREAFTLVALARQGLLEHVRAITVAEVRDARNQESVWLRPLWHVYKHNLPAGACGTFTCA